MRYTLSLPGPPTLYLADRPNMTARNGGGLTTAWTPNRTKAAIFDERGARQWSRVTGARMEPAHPRR